MARNLLSTILRSNVRKCPKCYLAFFSFTLALGFIAYLHLFQLHDIGSPRIQLPDSVKNGPQNIQKIEESKAMPQYSKFPIDARILNAAPKAIIRLPSTGPISTTSKVTIPNADSDVLTNSESRAPPIAPSNKLAKIGNIAVDVSTNGTNDKNEVGVVSNLNHNRERNAESEIPTGSLSDNNNSTATKEPPPSKSTANDMLVTTNGKKKFKRKPNLERPLMNSTKRIESPETAMGYQTSTTSTNDSPEEES